MVAEEVTLDPSIEQETVFGVVPLVTTKVWKAASGWAAMVFAATSVPFEVMMHCQTFEEAR